MRLGAEGAVRAGDGGCFASAAAQGWVWGQVHRGQDFDESCDVYALAVVLWELATLAFPFHDKPPQAIPGPCVMKDTELEKLKNCLQHATSRHRPSPVRA